MEVSNESAFCHNCKRDVAYQNFQTHIAFCLRKIKLCTLCDEPVQAEFFKEHLETERALVACTKCSQAVEKFLLPKHEESCPKRLDTCEYCEAEFPLNKLEEHNDYCGSRTEKCLLCQNFIMIKDFKEHNQTACPQRTVVCEMCGAIVIIKDFEDHGVRHVHGNLNYKKEVPQTFLETLSNELVKYLDEQVDTDCILKVGGAQIAAHKTMLCARSKVFAAMFRHDTTESHSGEVEIQSIEEAVVKDIVYYMYSGKIRGLESSTAVAMYEAADMYELLELKKACSDFLLQNLTVGNICNAAILAETYGESDLEAEVLKFVRTRLDEIKNSDAWKKFFEEKPLLVNKILLGILSGK